MHFVVEVDPSRATPCICGRCRGQGLRIAHGPSESFRVITGADHLTENFAEARTPHHFFCRTCGEAVFGRNRLPDGGETVSVNVVCLERERPDALADRKVHSREVSGPSGVDTAPRQPVSK